MPLSPDFQERLSDLKKQHSPKSTPAPPTPVIGIFFRIGIEMVVAIGLCTLIGIGIDRYWQTAPWGLLIGFFLGAGAGLRNAYRAASTFRYGPPPSI